MAKRKLSPALEANKWKPGQSGNPKGRPPRRTLESFVAEMLDEEVGTGESRIPRMRALAAVVVDEMLNRRNTQVMRPMFDRLWPAANTVDGTLEVVYRIHRGPKPE